MNDFDGVPMGLSMEQEFSLHKYSAQAKVMKRDELEEMLLEALRLFFIKERQVNHLLAEKIMPRRLGD